MRARHSAFPFEGKVVVADAVATRSSLTVDRRTDEVERAMTMTLPAAPSSAAADFTQWPCGPLDFTRPQDGFHPPFPIPGTWDFTLPRLLPSRSFPA